jgi:hypothetical protein
MIIVTMIWIIGAMFCFGVLASTHCSQNDTRPTFVELCVFLLFSILLWPAVIGTLWVR